MSGNRNSRPSSSDTNIVTENLIFSENKFVGTSSETVALTIVRCSVCGGILDVFSSPYEDSFSSAFAAHPDAMCHCSEISTTDSQQDSFEIKKRIRQYYREKELLQVEQRRHELSKDIEEFGKLLDDIGIPKKQDHIKLQTKDKPPIPGLRNQYGKKRKHK